MKRRTLPDVDRTAVPLTRIENRPARVHTVGRPRGALVDRDVRGGESDRASPLVTGDHLTADLVVPAEHLGCRSHVAPGQCPADGGRRDVLGRPRVGEQLQADDLEIAPVSEFGERVDVALTASSKVKVRTDHDDAGAHGVDKDLFGEVRVVGLGPLTREVHQVQVVDARSLEQLQALLSRRQQQWCALGPQHGRRMHIERDDCRLQVAVLRECTDSFEDELVSPVDAVVGADRERRMSVLRYARTAFADDLHHGSVRVAVVGTGTQMVEP